MTESHSAEERRKLEQAILDRFLALDPSEQRIHLRPEPETKSDLHLEESAQGYADPAAAEAEARILAAAGRRAEAARILLKLSVQMPEKSAYFADLLDNRAQGRTYDL